MSTPKTPPRGFTDKFLENLKPDTKRFELADKGCTGLRLRVQSTGSKSFIWYRKNPSTGKNQGVILGRYPELSLAEARKALEREKKLHAGGNVAPDSIPKTVKDLADKFYKLRIEQSLKRPDAVKQVLDNDVSAIGNRNLRTVTSLHLNSVIDAAITRGATTHAGKILSILKQMFAWAKSRGYLTDNPADALSRSSFTIVDNKRDRALDVDHLGRVAKNLKEIPALWNAIDNYKGLSTQLSFGLKILLLSGVRTSELRLAKWAAVDLHSGIWTIPISDQKIKPAQLKNAKAFAVPLSPTLIGLFTALKEQLSEDCEYVIPSPDESGPMSDKAFGRALRRMFEKKLLTIPHFTVHDLRRTMRTHIGSLGVTERIAEMCLNHSTGGRVLNTYDVDSLLQERRKAIEKWSRRVVDAVNKNKPTA